jgi:GNAT superfamily N-acetyltransferase
VSTVAKAVDDAHVALRCPPAREGRKPRVARGARRPHGAAGPGRAAAAEGPLPAPADIGPLVPDQGGHVVDAVFAGLSARSRLLRFHAPVPRLTAAMRRRLADVDGQRHVAVVALAAGADGGPQPVGVARAIGSGSGTADVAVAVVDAWQRRGLGRRLLTAVAAAAEGAGYTHLRGSVLPENTGMLGLARRLLPTVRPRRAEGTVELLVPLGAAAWTITDEDLLADLLAR